MLSLPLLLSSSIMYFILVQYLTLDTKDHILRVQLGHHLVRLLQHETGPRLAGGPPGRGIPIHSPSVLQPAGGEGAGQDVLLPFLSQEPS